jgi:hypothetical protein
MGLAIALVTLLQSSVINRPYGLSGVSKMNKSARFWTYHGEGLVKLTLHDGEALCNRRGSPTDEGWWSEAVIWRLENGIVERETIQDGRDCDGRLTRHYVDSCPIANLASEPAYYDPGYMVPTWQDCGSSQRDEYAEIAGY